MVTLSEENYLKTIYHLRTQDENYVSTNSIADKIETKASSVTDMLRKLSEKHLVDYVKYRGVKLTTEGVKAAVKVIRKHRLWEVFLVNKLNFSWDEVHEVAEQLEHIKSKKLVSQLDEYLDYPTHDPHGDPIPDGDGNIKLLDKILLANGKENSSYRCVGVDDSSSQFLQYLDKNKIALGSTLKVISKESFDESMIIEINKTHLAISKEVAKNLYIKTYKND